MICDLRVMEERQKQTKVWQENDIFWKAKKVVMKIFNFIQGQMNKRTALVWQLK